MERLGSLKDFDIPHKEPPLEKLEKWRKMCLVLNATRRFRYTANVKKRREQQKEKGKLKAAILATRAAFLFLDNSFPSVATEARLKAKQCGYNVDAQQLAGIYENNKLFGALGKVNGIAQKLKASLQEGIDGSKEDIDRRSEVFGKNVFTEKTPRGFWTFFWEAFHDLTLVMLIVCAAVSLAIGIPTEGIGEGCYDGIGILLSIAIVVFVTAASDYRQSLQFRDLEKEKKKIYVQVTRSGRRQQVLVHDLVVGDVVHLSTGDQVPADGVFISGYSLTVDESSLTGECEPVCASGEKPFLLSGTKVQNGFGKMLVTAVGMNTEWGNVIAALSEGGDDETPLQVKLNGVATLIGKIGLGFAIITLAVLLVQFLISKENLKYWSSADFIEIVDYFSIAVTIVVVAVPEGLPLSVTLSLAYAMKQMMKDKALVRHLSACETMGSATCICSDKTGTLTTNQMTVVKAWVQGKVQSAEKVRACLSENALEVILEGIFQNTEGDVAEYNDGPKILGTPTEAAILRFGLGLGGCFKDIRSKSEIVKIEPFNSDKKKMVVLLRLKDGKHRVHCKGAGESVLQMCNSMMDGNGQIIPLDEDMLTKVIESFSGEALRTLCIAFKDLGDEPFDEDSLPDNGFTCAAIIGIKDPVRPGVKEAVNLCFKAGIKVRMVTGDNIKTACAIARECNILTDGLAVEGPDFRKWTPQEMHEKISKIQVMARSSPSDKLLLVRNLKDGQEVVAATGDGTNDAPALHEADIGLAMGIAGTEVAKESADVVILDDNFSTVVNVAKWGRSIYKNIQKFVQFQLTVNMVALVMNFSSACITGRIPLTAVQLLWVNLIMDTLGALALATEPPSDELMELPPVGRKGNLISSSMWRNIFGQATYQLVILWALQYRGKEVLHLTGPNALGILDTVIFNSFVFCQVFNEINSREIEKLNVFKHTLSNSVFIAVILFTTMFQVVIVEFLGKLANTVPLSKEQWLISVLIGFCSLFVAFIVKLIPVPSKPFFLSRKLFITVLIAISAFLIRLMLIPLSPFGPIVLPEAITKVGGKVIVW
eukprot:c27815_g1_i1 orf=255-3401(+)